MNKPLPLLLAVVSLVLAGCGSTPGATQALKSVSRAPGASVALKYTPHSAREYYNSDQLRAATLSSCSATSEAEVDANLKLPACKAAMLAQSNRDLGLGVPN